MSVSQATLGPSQLVVVAALLVRVYHAQRNSTSNRPASLNVLDAQPTQSLHKPRRQSAIVRVTIMYDDEKQKQSNRSKPTRRARVFAIGPRVRKEQTSKCEQYVFISSIQKIYCGA